MKVYVLETWGDEGYTEEIALYENKQDAENAAALINKAAEDWRKMKNRSYTSSGASVEEKEVIPSAERTEKRI